MCWKYAAATLAAPLHDSLAKAAEDETLDSPTGQALQDLLEDPNCRLCHCDDCGAYSSTP